MTAHVESGGYGLLLAILTDTPKLEGALCVGQAHLFDPRGDDEPADEAAERRDRAAALCRRCPCLAGCREWVEREPALRNSGCVIATDGQIGAHPHQHTREG